ncbi:beta-barrel assembly-enhancing protease [Methylobacillus sp.]|mgnify:CR=1 FL=1|uniref:beta-barrel assembly-enhancing protease n=1 Tax=Methylobacillus sp. TaxID=56818 RepID=UPI002FE322E4
MKALYPIIFLAVFAPIALADGLPELGDYSATVMSALDEQRIADEIMKDVYASSQVVEDPEINDYIDDLGHRLAVAGPDKYQRFNFFVVKDNSINAFAMPGGVIGVHTGLLLAAKNESEVAGVLGHEIGHVVQRHLARMLAKQKNDSVISMATMALALLAARSNPQLTSGALVASGASAIQKQIDYTREHEREADRVGLQIMTDAGFDTRAMPAFFETLQKGTRFSEGSAPAFLRTHPLTVERIADVRNRVEQQASFRAAQESPDFYFIKAKLLADIGTADSAINTFRINLQEKRYASESAEHYGMALAMLRKNDLAGAREEVAWLRKNAIANALIETLATRVAVAGQPFEAAGQLYLQALGEYPEHRALIYDYANHLLGSRQLDKLLQLIADKLDRFPDDPYFYELRARAYSMQGKSLLMHQAQGEAYARRYNLRGAVEQMDLAARATDGDFYEKSIVEARLSQLRQRLDDKRTR